MKTDESRDTVAHLASPKADSEAACSSDEAMGETSGLLKDKRMGASSTASVDGSWVDVA